MGKNKEEKQWEYNKKVNDYELIYLYMQGDEEALLALIKKYKSIAYLYIDRYYHTNPDILDRHDMYQLSLISLYNAILTYNEEKNSSFSTYFSVLLNHDLLMYIRRVRKGRNRCNLNALSLNQEIRETDGIYLMDMLVNERVENEPEKYVSFRAMLKEIEGQLVYYGEEEQKVFHFWMDGYTYQEIADTLKIKRKKVEYIIQKVKAGLKNSLQDWK